MAKLSLRSGRNLVIGIESNSRHKTAEELLTEKINSMRTHITEKLLYEDSEGNLSDTGEEINVRTKAIDTWVVEDMEVKN